MKNIKFVKSKNSFKKGATYGFIKGALAISTAIVFTMGLVAPNPTGFFFWIVSVIMGLILSAI